MAEITYRYDDKRILALFQAANPQLNFGELSLEDVDVDDWGDVGGKVKFTMSYRVSAEQMAYLLSSSKR